MNKRRILLVEDERDIAELVTLHLSDQCEEIVVAHDGYEGMRLATTYVERSGAIAHTSRY
jgi:DNA-binding response OmpR family regulator